MYIKDKKRLIHLRISEDQFKLLESSYQVFISSGSRISFSEYLRRLLLAAVLK